MTMKTLTSIGFLFCIQTFLDEFWGTDTKGACNIPWLTSVLSSTRTPEWEGGPRMGKTCGPHQERTSGYLRQVESAASKIKPL
jgi:hypothetical protein